MVRLRPHVSLAALAALAACGASIRSVVTMQSEFQEVEAGAQPGGSLATPDRAAATSDPATGSGASVTGGGSTTTGGGLVGSTGPIVFGLLDGEAALEDAWDRWNNGKTTTYDEVFEIAVLANRARPLPMSDELMVIALARAVGMSSCEPERLGRIRLLAIAVNTSPHTRELDSELERLADVGPVECAAL
jgi:hypothetical protein